MVSVGFRWFLIIYTSFALLIPHSQPASQPAGQPTNDNNPGQTPPLHLCKTKKLEFKREAGVNEKTAGA
ncbi:hypothetical protein N9L68_05725 [bacterium]|nr:hypothetical protein [bacterium]